MAQPDPLSRRQRSLHVLRAIADWDDEGQPDHVLQLPRLQARVAWSEERSQELVSLLQEMVDRRWIEGEPITTMEGTVDFFIRRITASGRDALYEAQRAARELPAADRAYDMKRLIASIQRPDLRDGMDRLIDAIQEEDLDAGSRKAALDAAEDLVEAATLPPEQRKRSRIIGAAHVFSELALTAAAVATVWKVVEPLVVHYLLPHLP